MTLLIGPVVVDASCAAVTPSTAALRADANARANRAALAKAQPAVGQLLAAQHAELEWRFARDASLTAMVDGHWWGGNSLPARSAAVMLKDVDATAAASCMVAPVHAAQIRCLLDRTEPQQATLIVQPDLLAACVAMGCENFADDIAAGRLWWAVGPDWADQLDHLLASLPGLAIPTRFIRTSDVTDAAANPIITLAGQVFGRHTSARNERVAQLRNAGARRSSCVARICVVGGSRFRLWANAPGTLRDTLLRTTPQQTAVSWHVVDTDSPITNSPLAIAAAASASDAIVMADVGRANYPNLLASDLPWITWATTPGLPGFSGAGPRDRLLLADPAWQAAATAGGWPPDRIAVATWPTVERVVPPVRLVLLVDIGDMSPPAFTEEFSSHRLAWEAVRAELTRDPLVASADVNAYLDRRLRSAQIDPASVDRLAFIEKLILPAFAVGVATVLMNATLPLAIYGKGWESTACRDGARGELTTRAAFEQAVQGAALVRPWPVPFRHEIDAQGVPVITPAGSANALVAQARAALERPTMMRSACDTTLNAGQILASIGVGQR
jgi:hypothetical protein